MFLHCVTAAWKLGLTLTVSFVSGCMGEAWFQAGICNVKLFNFRSKLKGKKHGLTGCANEWILDLQAHAVRQDAHFDYFLLSRSRPVRFKRTTGSSCLEGNITSCGGLHFSSFLLFWAIGTVCQCHWGRERHPGKLVLARWSHIVNEVINGWEWGSQCKVKWCYMHVCVWLQLTFLFFFFLVLLTFYGRFVTCWQEKMSKAYECSRWLASWLYYCLYFTHQIFFFFFFVTVDRYHLYVYTPVCDTSTGLRRTRDSVGFCTWCN